MSRRAKRDEFSCPCCGDSGHDGYCLACEVFECGEQSVSDECLVPKRVEVLRARHAAHYEGGGGHDLLTVDVRLPVGEDVPFNARGEPDVRPPGLPLDFKYHSGTRGDVVHGDRWQCWRFTKIAPLSPGKCGFCR